MNVEKEREYAGSLVKWLQEDPDKHDVQFPLEIACAWEQAISAKELEYTRLREVFEKAKDRRELFERGSMRVGLFYSHMEALLKEMVRESFEQ
jgi:hypothetical protein